MSLSVCVSLVCLSLCLSLSNLCLSVSRRGPPMAATNRAYGPAMACLRTGHGRRQAQNRAGPWTREPSYGHHQAHKRASILRLPPRARTGPAPLAQHLRPSPPQLLMCRHRDWRQACYRRSPSIYASPGPTTPTKLAPPSCSVSVNNVSLSCLSISSVSVCLVPRVSVCLSFL